MVLGGMAGVRAAEPGWLNLLPGKTLKGWKAEGHAIWSVEDGVLVGHPAPGGIGGDLFTEKQWADFELESEWKIRWPANSGIWFRVNGKDTGYQADILDDAVVRSGSLYCMGKAFIAENHDPATVNKDDWNRTRIVAQGDDFLIEQNGKKVVQVSDHTFPGAGSVGIQVHEGAMFQEMEVRVRMLRLRPIKRGARVAK
jgi:hypothetical protein